MNKRTRAQVKAEWKRAHDSEEFLSWTRERVSVASGLRGCICHHVRNVGGPTGAGRKPDACWIVPLTDEEHRELHYHGERTFERNWEINLADEAREHWAKWRELEE